MTTYEAISLMILFSMLVIALVSLIITIFKVIIRTKR